MIKTDDLTGNVYGRLTVLNREEDKGREHTWLCRCECGNTKIIRGPGLKYGRVKSCGCFRKDITAKRSTKHGLSDSRFYRIWCGMKTRCNNPNDKFYHIYGGKGIYFDNGWEEFNNFKEDMYDSYLRHVKDFGESHTTLDRIDSSKGYTKDNCRWATPLEQVKNRNYKSGHVGVNRDSNNEGWVATIGVDYKLKYLGYFKDKEDAVKARKEAELKYWGTE